MAHKNVNFIISADLMPSKPDLLLSDCLRVEVAPKVVLSPGKPTTINLTIHNTSSVGRIAHLRANFDSSLRVTLADSEIYVAPGGATVTFAVVTPHVTEGRATVSFDAS